MTYLITIRYDPSSSSSSSIYSPLTNKQSLTQVTRET